MSIKSIRKCKNLKNKAVLVRCDFDVPFSKTQNSINKTQGIKITDDSRLRAAVPTINYLLGKGARVVLMGHLGRPKGVDKKLSLLPVKNELEKILNNELGNKDYGIGNKKKIQITFISDFEKRILRRPTLGAPQDRLCMIENLRFQPGEEKNDPKFAEQLAKLGDFYVNEAFAVSHRSAASVDAIKRFLPSYAGLNLEQEVLHLSAVLNKPQKPMVAIIGGAKIETKLPVIKQFLKTANYILIGGGVANTFLKAQGVEVGKSLIDDKFLGEAKKMLKNVKIQMTNVKSMSKSKCQIIIPIDWQESGEKILDIGPKTIWLFSGIIKKAKTVVWNGPMGYFEDQKFAKGTDEIAKAILNSKATAVIGGGETGEAVKKLTTNNKQLTTKNKQIFISTGGGAMLEYLGGKKLPGLNTLIAH